ncbi:MAG TPA: hypothetical protein VFK44_09490 [Bacillales bacterium]|nr:hypothetical protein [Bacillales bacterium]
MEERIYNTAVLKNQSEGFARSVSQEQNSESWERKAGKMDSLEFFWTVSGAVVIGASVYLLSLI